MWHFEPPLMRLEASPTIHIIVEPAMRLRLKLLIVDVHCSLWCVLALL